MIEKTGKIELVQGDITKIKVDAIVNAANESLLGGGGVDGAIHRVAGAELLKECRSLNGCKTGQAKVTKGHNLLAKYVIHTVGPVYEKNDDSCETLLESCYFESLKIAGEMNLKSIAFPCISTGIYGYPKKYATGIAVQTVRTWAKRFGVEEVYFVVFDGENHKLYKSFLDLQGWEL